MGIRIMIESLEISKLNQFNDKRGGVFHFINKNHPQFRAFGEVYFSKVNYKVVKGWKLHTLTFQNFCVPHGRVKIVIYDPRKNSKSYGLVQELVLDNMDNYCLLSIPPGLWYSFKGETKSYSLLANLIDIKHKEAIVKTIPISNEIIPYEWN